MCWKYCVSIVAVCFVGVLGWGFYKLPSLNDVLPGTPRVEVRESWAEVDDGESDVEVDDSTAFDSLEADSSTLQTSVQKTVSTTLPERIGGEG